MLYLCRATSHRNVAVSRQKWQPGVTKCCCLGVWSLRQGNKQEKQVIPWFSPRGCLFFLGSCCRHKEVIRLERWELSYFSVNESRVVASYVCTEWIHSVFFPVLQVLPLVFPKFTQRSSKGLTGKYQWVYGRSDDVCIEQMIQMCWFLRRFSPVLPNTFMTGW